MKVPIMIKDNSNSSSEKDNGEVGSTDSKQRKTIVIEIALGFVLIVIGLAILINLNPSQPSDIYNIEWFSSILLPTAGMILLLYVWFIVLYRRSRKYRKPLTYNYKKMLLS